MHVFLECRRNVILLTEFHDLHSQYPLPNYFPFSATTFIYILCWSENSIFTRYFSYNHAFLRPVDPQTRRAASGRSPAEILGSNPTGGMDICLL